MRGLARLHAVAAAVLLCTGLTLHSEAQALALGRIVVQSALGEPLRAEIEVPEITAEEASSLRVGLASAEAFRAAGMEINPALGDLQVSLQRRANGAQYLRLSSTRPVNEPFMDMILEVNWASGRIVRDYTLLFDPPNLRQASTPAPLAPAVSAQPAPVQAPVARPAAPPAAVSAPAPVARPEPAQAAPAPRSAPAPSPAPTRAQTPVAAKPAPAADTDAGQQLRVRAGETASRIATRNKPANVSLDQMLVAMLRANPNAFIDGNVNRIKAGAVLDLPEQAQASAIPVDEARQVIAAQSRDFNEFRRRLAGSVPDANVGGADRQAAGRVQAEVQDKKPAAPTQDKLTLSKGSTPSQASEEAKIAQERQAKEAASRAAEISRNIEDLAKLGTSTVAATAPTAPTAGTPTTPGLSVPGAVATAPVSTPTTTATVAAAPTETAAPAVQTPTPATPAPAALPAPAPAAEEPSFMAQLGDNPLVLPAAGGLLALLAGFGFYRLRQQKKGSGVDSSFLESRLQPDSFFGSSGGQRIDTAEASASGSSMVYSPSQLDAAGDVDPVAEADVYLAYGRDLQAEEILKEAMRSTPTRVAIHNKLLEIYAKRRDAKAFEVVATEAFGLTQGQGPEWEHACDLGKELDPGNPLYQPGGSPTPKPGAPGGTTGMATVPFGSSTLTQHTRPGTVTVAPAVGLDMALDLDLDEPSGHAQLNPSVPPDAAMSGMDDLNTTEALTSRPTEDMIDSRSMPMDFDLDFPSAPVALEQAKADAPVAGASMVTPGQVTFDDNEVLPDFSLDVPPQPAAPVTAHEPALDMGFAAAPAAVAPPVAPEMLSFDLSNINLDLGDKTPPPATDFTPSELGRLTAENPLETKLSLAEEFRAIGDLEGARSLAEEVLAEASGALKTKAGSFLNDLA
ncbi:MAG: fimbrial protein FimV [Comamonadaceae bacterium]|nr:fimbrial protein FimV [Comamonadaceae bacterium]